MPSKDLRTIILEGNAPQQIKMLVAKGLAPLAPLQSLELIVFLSKDSDAAVSSTAVETLSRWDEQEMIAQLKSPDCSQTVLQHFAETSLRKEAILQEIVNNPSTSVQTISSLAAIVPLSLLEKILDNRTRIIQSPELLESIRKNPFAAAADIQRQIHEIEIEFLGGKKKEYFIEEASPLVKEHQNDLSEAQSSAPAYDEEFDVSFEELSLEGLPVEAEARKAEITKRLSSMPVRQKIQLALFGTREIRSALIRDSNKEVSRTVLRSPKITENEIESISAMRGVPDDILREIGGSRVWIKNYTIVQNLVKNPKTPPIISQRLIFRLLTKDLMLLSRDRSVPDSVRQNAARVLNQRNSKRTQ
jgi:hypothetical protein